MRQLVVSPLCACAPDVLHKANFFFKCPFKNQFKIYFDFMNILINFFLVSAQDQRGNGPHLIMQEITSYLFHYLKNIA